MFSPCDMLKPVITTVLSRGMHRIVPGMYDARGFPAHWSAEATPSVWNALCMATWESDWKPGNAALLSGYLLEQPFWDDVLLRAVERATDTTRHTLASSLESAMVSVMPNHERYRGPLQSGILYTQLGDAALEVCLMSFAAVARRHGYSESTCCRAARRAKANSHLRYVMSLLTCLPPWFTIRGKKLRPNAFELILYDLLETGTPAAASCLFCLTSFLFWSAID